MNISFIKGGKDKSEDLSSHLTPLIETYQKLLEKEEDYSVDDSDFRNLSVTLVNTLNLLCGQIPIGSISLPAKVTIFYYILNSHKSIQ